MDKRKPTAISGTDNMDISALKPRREMSHAVTVVPMLAPIMTPTACERDRRLAFTKLTTITVVALEDWIKAVIKSPVSTLLKGLDVIDARMERILSPAAFWSPSLMRVIP